MCLPSVVEGDRQETKVLVYKSLPSTLKVFQKRVLAVDAISSAVSNKHENYITITMKFCFFDVLFHGV